MNLNGRSQTGNQFDQSRRGAHGTLVPLETISYQSRSCWSTCGCGWRRDAVYFVSPGTSWLRCTPHVVTSHLPLPLLKKTLPLIQTVARNICNMWRLPSGHARLLRIEPGLVHNALFCELMLICYFPPFSSPFPRCFPPLPTTFPPSFSTIHGVP